MYNKHNYNKLDPKFINLLLDLKRLTFNNLKELENIEPNKYYFKELGLPINSYLCIYNKYFFISINKRILLNYI